MKTDVRFITKLMVKGAEMNKKIYAFIDSQNLNLGVRSQGWRLDIDLLRKKLKQ